MASEENLLTIRLTDIDGFERITARMPTEHECRRGYPAGVPVVVMRKHGLADELVYRADLTEFTIDNSPPPDPDGTRAAASHAIGHVTEQLRNYTDDLAHLAVALRQSPRSVVELGQRLHDEQRRQERSLALLERHEAEQDSAGGGKS